jgi:diguanylate cyclase (GGDEF)-like protein
MKFNENRICFKINYFVENVLKIRSFATKITLMFFLLFIISTLLSFCILSYFQVEEIYKSAKESIKLAVNIRQNLSEQKLEIIHKNIENALKNNLTDKLKSYPFIKVFKETKQISKPYKYFYEDGIIYFYVKSGENFYLAGVDEKIIDKIIKVRTGAISVYNPDFYISKEIPSDGICSSKKYSNSDFYLIGCIENKTVFQMALSKVFKDSAIFFTSFIFILLISFFVIKKFLLFPFNYLTQKLLEIQKKGIKEVKFELHNYGNDELAKVSSLLEDFRKKIIKDDDKFKLLYEIVANISSMSNNFEKFAGNTIDKIDKVLNLEGSILVSVFNTSRTDVFYSQRAKQKGVKINLNQLIEKLENKEIFKENQNGIYTVYIKKKINEDMSLIFICFKEEVLEEEDINYINVILSNFAYILNIYNLATLDSLTKIPNRRKIMMELEKESLRSKRYKRPLSVAMIDIDDFKIINDSYGHDVGDLALLKIVEVLKKSLRSTDIVGRYGGEEFLVVMPETNLEGALKAAEKIRKNIETFPLIIKDNVKIPLTVSIGIANTQLYGSDPLTLLKAADIALYKAKKSGKNRVEFLNKEEIEYIISSEFKLK